MPTIDMNMPILIVDDYRTMLKIIRNLLSRLGFSNVDEATDAGVALKKLRDKAYGLVISDCHMEPTSGLDLLKEVRADTQLAALPFLMITSEGKSETVEAAKQAGVSNCIATPFDAATLRTKLTAVVGDF